MKENNNLGAIILAAGKGRRMNLKDANKTTLLLKGKPLITYPVELIASIKADPIIVVVGYAKDSVIKTLRDFKVIFAEQKKRLGTGHAVKTALAFLPENIKNVLVINGDDSYVYSAQIIEKIINLHLNKKSAITLLTVEVPNPGGLGRIIRNQKSEIIEIVEEKDLKSAMKTINEINPNVFVYRTDFLNKYISKIPRNPVTGEYYLPALIKMANQNNERIESINAGMISWRGINTKEEFAEARRILEK